MFVWGGSTRWSAMVGEKLAATLPIYNIQTVLLSSAVYEMGHIGGIKTLVPSSRLLPPDYMAWPPKHTK